MTGHYALPKVLLTFWRFDNEEKRAVILNTYANNQINDLLQKKWNKSNLLMSGYFQQNNGSETFADMKKISIDVRNMLYFPYQPHALVKQEIISLGKNRYDEYGYKIESDFAIYNYGGHVLWKFDGKFILNYDPA